MEYCYHDSYKAMKAKCILGKSLWVIVLAYLTVMRKYKVSLGATGVQSSFDVFQD